MSLTIIMSRDEAKRLYHWLMYQYADPKDPDEYEAVHDLLQLLQEFLDDTRVSHRGGSDDSRPVSDIQGACLPVAFTDEVAEAPTVADLYKLLKEKGIL